jgi:hypothetical protein
MFPRSLIPAIQHRIPVPSEDLSAHTLVTGVFAIDTTAKHSPSQTLRLWTDPPSGHLAVINDEIRLTYNA